MPQRRTSWRSTPTSPSRTGVYQCKTHPASPFLPSTVLGLQSIVKYAAKNNYRVRCAGHRHSWSPAFSQDSQVLVSFVKLETVDTLPNPMSIIGGDYIGQTVPELKTIELGESTQDGKRLCRIGAAVTNGEFRGWSVAQNAYALPVNVIMVEITFGGSNAPMSDSPSHRFTRIQSQKPSADPGSLYSEWFRFTYQQKARVNTWKPTTDSTNVISYPNDAQVFLQWVEGWIGGIMTSSRLFNTIPGYLQAQLLATIGMAALPPTKGEQDTPRCETSVMNAVSSGQHLSRKTRS